MNDILFCFLFQLFFDYTQPLHGFKPKKIEERILLFKLLLKVKEFFIFFTWKNHEHRQMRALNEIDTNTYLQYWLHRIGEKNKIIRYTINDGVECYVEPGREERQTHPKSITILFSYRKNETERTTTSITINFHYLSVPRVLLNSALACVKYREPRYPLWNYIFCP